MKKILISCIFSYILLANFGLAKKYYNIPFLEKVERTPAIEKDFSINEKLTYKDPLINITWEPEPKGFYFNLTNVSDSTISIIWHECYLDDSILKYTIVHKDIKNIQVMPSTNISPKKKIDDYVYPSAFVRFVHGRYTELKQKKIYRKKIKQKTVSNNSYKPQTFIITMTIKADDNHYVYVFHFKTELVEK